MNKDEIDFEPIAPAEQRSRTSPAAPARGEVTGRAGEPASAARINAAFKAGQLSREEAVRQLQALGFQ